MVLVIRKPPDRGGVTIGAAGNGVGHCHHGSRLVIAGVV